MNIKLSMNVMDVLVYANHVHNRWLPSERFNVLNRIDRVIHHQLYCGYHVTQLGYNVYTDILLL